MGITVTGTGSRYSCAPKHCPHTILYTHVEFRSHVASYATRQAHGLRAYLTETARLGETSGEVPDLVEPGKQCSAFPAKRCVVRVRLVS